MPSLVDKISDPEFIEKVNRSTSYTNLCMMVGYKGVSSWCVKKVKERIKKLGIEPSYKPKNKDLLDAIVTGQMEYSNSTYLLHLLIKFKYLTYSCNICSNSGQWLGSPLCLELDHIDGNNKNNSLSNLRILCPNCHSQTDTFRGRNNRIH